MYQKLLGLMEQHHESAADLSRATGIPQNTISNWSKRKGGMSINNAVKIASHYGINVEELLRND